MTPQAEILQGLLLPQASISPKYFYDAAGSALFEQITLLPEYYPTRVERQIMTTHASDIACRMGAGVTVIEPGAGNCEKARALCELIHPRLFVALDISEDFLHQAVAGLRAALPGVEVSAVVADLTRAITLPVDLPMAQRLVFYPGSSIGNFDPPQALALVTRLRGLLADDGALLIGVDLVKDMAVLHAAYDDAQGVTAAFNLNVLKHVNRVVGSDFDVTQWQHLAFFNPVASRIEMHLQASTATDVHWPGGGRSFAQGERIHTENSYKYQVADFVELLKRAGLSQTQVWTDPDNWFAVILAHP
ncbi:L-histidine N(alpha)-methyltransferase [Rhodoferax sp.]|uniref:L-histidine N(alpha)-methyltransferase n=1 Tax=Rhodoferax sp. TaxID=50421 RepID=UPI00261208CE|nr:L-histidine N(alpha)-methyltransferase [Rhodoferax sp.]MDD2919511.1 L-histidine N(alpha)-methyltransferase [Rhodoferax sp.]